MTIAKQERLAELVTMIRDTRGHGVGDAFRAVPPTDSCVSPRQPLWQAETAYYGEMSSEG